MGGEAEEEEEEDLGLEDLAWSRTFAWSVSTHTENAIHLPRGFRVYAL